MHEKYTFFIYGSFPPNSTIPSLQKHFGKFKTKVCRTIVGTLKTKQDSKEIKILINRDDYDRFDLTDTSNLQCLLVGDTHEILDVELHDEVDLVIKKKELNGVVNGVTSLPTKYSSFLYRMIVNLQFD